MNKANIARLIHRCRACSLRARLADTGPFTPSEQSTTGQNRSVGHAARGPVTKRINPINSLTTPLIALINFAGANDVRSRDDPVA